jgi:hypothetical protein
MRAHWKDSVDIGADILKMRYEYGRDIGVGIHGKRVKYTKLDSLRREKIKNCNRGPQTTLADQYVVSLSAA